jgi:hypothetical protein
LARKNEIDLRNYERKQYLIDKNILLSLARKMQWEQGERYKSLALFAQNWPALVCINIFLDKAWGVLSVDQQ